MCSPFCVGRLRKGALSVLSARKISSSLRASAAPKPVPARPAYTKLPSSKYPKRSALTPSDLFCGASEAAYYKFLSVVAFDFYPVAVAAARIGGVGAFADNSLQSSFRAAAKHSSPLPSTWAEYRIASLPSPISVFSLFFFLREEVRVGLCRRVTKGQTPCKRVFSVFES